MKPLEPPILVTDNIFLSIVADPDPFDTDPDPALHFDTDPDPNPAFQLDTNPDPAVCYGSGSLPFQRSTVMYLKQNFL